MPAQIYFQSIHFSDKPGSYEDGYSSPGWYFWDETQAFRYGPYASGDMCREKMTEYANQL